jgi:pimeloyl-ACP methyl ester carboxylesterase
MAAVSTDNITPRQTGPAHTRACRTGWLRPRTASTTRTGTPGRRRLEESRDPASSWATRQAQYDAVCTWGIPDHALLQQVSCLQVPVFAANGHSDPMILPHYTYLLAGLIPQAQVKIYPDSAHGFLFQHHARFAADVEAFLSESSVAGNGAAPGAGAGT